MLTLDRSRLVSLPLMDSKEDTMATSDVDGTREPAGRLAPGSILKKHQETS